MRLIVVGAGIVGSACAYAASSLGAEVTLIDAGWPGQATAAGAGIICPWTSGVDDPGGYDFACAAARAYPALVAELADLGETDISYRRSGAIVVADREDELEPVRAGLEAQRAGHPEMGDVQVVTGSAVQRLFPPLRPHMPAVHIPGAARVDGRKFRDALVRAACRKGATIRAGDAALVCRAGRAAGVLAEGELIEADAVVAATGAWTTSFVEPAGRRGPGHPAARPDRAPLARIGGHASLAGGPARRQRPLPARLRGLPGGRRRDPGARRRFRSPGDGGGLVAGPGGGPDRGARASDPRPTWKPGWASARRVPASGPLLGPVPGVAGLFVATGLGAEGLTMGPYAGGVAARAALGLDPGLDLAPFDPLRQ